MRDNAADLFAGLALFTVGGVDQIPADASVLAVGSSATKGTGQLLLAPHCLFHVSLPSLTPRHTQMQRRKEQASRSQLGAVAKIQVFVSFDVAHYTSELLAFSQIAQNAPRMGASPYPLYKNLYFFSLKGRKSEGKRGVSGGVLEVW